LITVTLMPICDQAAVEMVISPGMDMGKTRKRMTCADSPTLAYSSSSRMMRFLLFPEAAFKIVRMA
jgi:hypothetical protein